MYDNHTQLPGTGLRSALFVVAMFFSVHAAANECLNLFPYDATEDGLPKICQSAFNGKQANYSCQDYRSGDNRYRILYKGGRTPKAVLALNADGSEQLLSSPLFGDQTLNCPLNAPAGVPKHAMHRGIGVCRDENDKPVACSIFQYAAARETVTHSYMVYYPGTEQKKIRVEVEEAGANKDAMVAELAFQLGMSLWKTDCCHAQAVQYLAYAYHLFPRSETYRHAYQRGRAVLALGDY